MNDWVMFVSVLALFDFAIVPNNNDLTVFTSVVESTVAMVSTRTCSYYLKLVILSFFTFSDTSNKRVKGLYPHCLPRWWLPYSLSFNWTFYQKMNKKPNFTASQIPSIDLLLFCQCLLRFWICMCLVLQCINFGQICFSVFLNYEQYSI